MRNLLSFLAFVVLFMGLLNLSLVGCSNTTPTQDIEISQAPIHEVQVRIAESFPPQIFLYIKGGLRDGCTTFHDIVTERNSNSVNVKVTTQHPKGVDCPAVYKYFEKNINLGSDFVSGQTYDINVNDYSTSFVMQ